MSSLKAPYGTWASPITAEAITKGANAVAELVVDRVTSEVYHIESRPSEEGRNVLVHTATNRDIVGPQWDVRTMVQEYGGAPAIVHNGVAYFSYVKDGRVYRLDIKENKEPVAVTPGEKPFRYACLEPVPEYPHLLVSILEDHTEDVPSKVVTTLVVIDTTAKVIHPLLSGKDFYAQPKLSPNGKQLAWVQWSHPDMPWEGGEIHVGDVIISNAGILSIENDTHVAGEPVKVGAGYPAWASDGILVYTTDESGFANPWKYDTSKGKASPLLPEPISQDFAEPCWNLSTFPFAFLDKEGKVGLFTAFKDGHNVLYLVDLSIPSKPKLFNNSYVVIQCVSTLGGDHPRAVFMAQKTNETTSIVQCSLSASSNLIFEILKPAHNVEIDGVPLPPTIISEPQPITLNPSTLPLYVVYYPPHNPNYSGSSIPGERPPCVVHSHGGPTSLTAQSLTWSKQYFTSRGWAWLDVNYGGSSGFGRKYIERLSTKWGIVDVADFILATHLLSAEPYNLIDPKRLTIRGGSSGGFTTLACISNAQDVKVFAVATSLYGICDLEKLAEFTHKFESRYLDHLIGGTVEEIPEVYKERSPINHADNIVVPLLLLQGEIDMVVPKGQAEAIYKSIKDRGGVVELKLYEGEGHGFRQESNMRDALELRLGSSGLKVSKIILGCMSYGSPEWQAWVLSEEESIKHIKAAYEAGINTFDTANVYSNGESEVILGKAIKELQLPRDEIVVMTKVFFTVGRKINEVTIGINPDEMGYVNQHGLSRKHIFESIKHSLERLQLDYVDVLQCHRFDPETPIAETMQALHDVVQAGYARYIGMSSCWAWQFHAMQNYAIANKLTPFISMQNHYNLVYREEEREMMPTLSHLGVGSIPWSPLARGLLTRSLDSETTRGKTDRMIKGYSNNQGTKEIVEAVQKLAEKKGVSMAQLALAWVMAKPGVSAPIVGTTSLENLHDLLGAVDVKLSEEEVKELEQSYQPQAAFGHS